MADKTLSNKSSRQKIILVVFVLIAIFLVWQIYSMIRSSSVSAAAQQAAQQAPKITPPPQSIAELPKTKPEAMTPQEMELMRLQQETQAKYVAALNQLQMLKLEKDIAESEKDIMKARQEYVAAQKGIVDLLVPQQPQATNATYAQGLVMPTGTTGGTPPEMVSPTQTSSANIPSSEIKYTVVSVSQIQKKWSAVLGFQGNLYNVFVGDILPVDGSKVISIDSTGVVLEKDDQKKKISLVSVI